MSRKGPAPKDVVDVGRCARWLRRERFLPKDRIAVLGLVTSKANEMETADALKRRIEDAARFTPLKRLAISPQCGFASSIPGNLISEESQRAKLALCTRVATDVWGSAA